MATKRRLTTVPDLKMAVVAWLLRGPSADPPPGVDPGPHGFGHGFLEAAERGGLAKLWRAHEAWLVSHARVWGWRPMCVGSDGVRRFYAEALAHEETMGHAPSQHGDLLAHEDELDEAADEDDDEAEGRRLR